MAYSTQDIIDPEATRLVAYESSIKSGTHGEIYQKQLAQILLLRLTRTRKHFLLAYELTSADKFDDVVMYDETAKQWTFLQLKHADGKDSKIDLNGLLPKTNREKGDFSLHKYFKSYMLIRNKFKGKLKFLLFTNKKLDEKLQTAEDCMVIKDQYVDEYLRFTSEGATQKSLIPTESTIESIMEYANKDLHSLKDAIKQLFTKGIITDQLLKYKAYLKDVLKESRNCQISFTDTFNESLIFISELYKKLQFDIHNFKPIGKPPELDVKEIENDSTNLSSVDFEHLADAIDNLFRNEIVSDYLKKYKNLLAMILTTTENHQITLRDTFKSDVISKAELYKLLKAELSDMNKVISTNQKLFDGKDFRSKHHSVLLYAEESDVRQFFALLTLSVHQPDELEPFIVEELHSWMKMWLRPDVLGKLTEHDDKNAVKDLDDHFEVTLKREQGNFKPYLNQQHVSQFCNKLQAGIAKLHPELNDTNQLYINRVLTFEKEDIDEPQHLRASQFGVYTSSVLSLNLEGLFSHDDTATENELERDDILSQPNKTCEEITDSEFAANLMIKFAQYQCLVLTADPGIGKTKLLQYLALEHQKLELGTVYLFYLSRLQDSENFSDIEASLNILKPMLSDKNILLIQKALGNRSDDHITILFDGYDEVHKKNIDKINRLLKLLFTSKQIQVIISVRNHEKNALQRFFKKHKINARCFCLKPFSSENIIEYLAQSWKNKVEIDIDLKFNSYSKFLVDTFYSLCRVPLMVKMMSNIYKQRFEQFKEISMTNKEEEISYLKKEFSEVEHIYENFIENCLLVKIQDACHGIGKVDPNKHIFEGFYLDHQLLAIEFLDVVELKFIFKTPKYLKKWDCIKKCHINQFDKSILLNFVDGKVLFSHHSYAEYFVATFLWDDFINLKNIVKNVLSGFTGIRRFFIKIIEKNIKLFVSEIAQEASFDSKDVVFWACENNAVELLKYVLSKNRRKILFRPSEAKMFHIAVKNGSDKICSYLIDDCKVHPDKYYGGLAPLHAAIIYGHIYLVQLLLEKGADLNILSTAGWSALHYTVHHKQMAIAKILIDKGTDVNSRNKTKWNALHISCNNGDADMTRMLIQKGARHDVKTVEGKTPLDLAVTGGHREVVMVLIEHLIDFFLYSWKTDDELWTVVRYGHHSVKEMLEREYKKLPALLMCLDDPDIVAWEIIVKKIKKMLNDGANVNAPSKTGSTVLHLSASEGYDLVVEQLLGEGADVNAVDEDNWTPLHFACWNGHYKVVELLIKQKADIDALDCQYLTPLYLACQNGHKKVVEILTRENANIEASDDYNWTQLHFACQNGDNEVAEQLIEQTSDINALAHGNCTPLHVACLNGHIEIVKIMIREKANINALTEKKDTPLHAACWTGHTEIVEILIREKANINASNDQNCTPLHFACQNGHTEVVEILIGKGANIYALTKKHHTPFYLACLNGHEAIALTLILREKINIDALNHLACWNGHKEVVEVLLMLNANPDALAHKNCTPLHLACHNGHKEVVEILLRGKANIHALTKTMDTPLHVACCTGNIEIVQILLTEKANIHALAYSNWTPLHLACQHGHKEIVEILLRENANIDALDFEDFTPLHFACHNGHDEIVEILLIQKANIDALDHKNLTPLHLACLNGHKKVVEILLREKANIDALNDENCTPLHLARRNGHKEVVAILLKEKANIAPLDREDRIPRIVNTLEKQRILL